MQVFIFIGIFLRNRQTLNQRKKEAYNFSMALRTNDRNHQFLLKVSRIDLQRRNCLAVHERLKPAVLTEANLLLKQAA